MRRDRDERGMTLVLCLVVVSVVGLIVSATLVLEDATMSYQSAVEGKRELFYTGDAAIDTAIHNMRDIVTAGRYDPDHPDGASQECLDAPGFPYFDEDLGVEVFVDCRPYDAESGSPAGTAGEQPDNVILALGGSVGDGNDEADSVAEKSQKPYCDDYYASASCEPSIQIGPGTYDGGMVVYPNGSEANKPLVVANGAIITKDGSANRKLIVRGGVVKARRTCGEVVTETLNKEPLPENKQCVESESADTITQSPQWKHEWKTPLDNATRNDVTNMPTTNVRLAPQQAPPVSECTDRYVEFRAGWYRSVTELNALMKNCPEGTFYWFEPGLYYFDFEDLNKTPWPAGTPEFWQEPVKFGQIVGGTSPDDSWNRCNANNTVTQITNCTQPLKVMTANRVNPTPNDWGIDLNDDDDVGDAGEATVTQAATEIDRVFTVIKLTGKIGEEDENDENIRTAKLVYDRMTTPLPLGNRTRIRKIVVRINHTMTPHSETPYASGTPSLEINVGASDKCTIDLKADQDHAGGKITRVADASRKDYGTTLIDLTDGCPTGEGGSVSGTFPSQPHPSTGTGPFVTGTSGASWTVERVNGIKLTYRASRADKNLPPTVRVDGVDVQVEYKGPPSPTFPGGCDPERAGVQFIFGNLSRAVFSGNDVWVELCGGLAGRTEDDRAIGFYALPYEPQAVPEPVRYLSGYENLSLNLQHVDPSLPGPVPVQPRTLASSPHFSSTYPAWEPPAGGLTVPKENGSWVGAGTNGVDWWEQPDDAYGFIGTNTGHVNNPQLNVQLPADAIPVGSVVEAAQLRVRYAANANVSTVTYKVTKGSNTQDASEVDGGSTDSGTIERTGANVNSVTGAVTRAQLQTHITDNSGSWWRAAGSPSENATTTWTEEFKWTDIYGDDANERDLVHALRTPNGWRGATISVAFLRPSGGLAREIALDAVEVVVFYRPPGEPRPLRGCLTLRTTEATDAAATAAHVSVHHIHNGPPFRTPAAGSDTPFRGTSGSGSVLKDENACAVLYVQTGSANDGTKFHLAGALYAPTAAVLFAGRDNEAPFVTDGLVVRQLSALRWREGPEIGAFGGGATTRRDPRRVVLTVCTKRCDEAGAKVIKEAVVEFDDGGALDPELYGQKVHVHDWGER